MVVSPGPKYTGMKGNTDLQCTECQNKQPAEMPPFWSWVLHPTWLMFWQTLHLHAVVSPAVKSVNRISCFFFSVNKVFKCLSHDTYKKLEKIFSRK